MIRLWRRTEDLKQEVQHTSRVPTIQTRYLVIS